MATSYDLVGNIILGSVKLTGITNPATYYVDFTGGSDTATGFSSALAWKTIAKVNATVFVPGDTILFKRGETWRDDLIVGQSGAVGAPITYGAYGEGALPSICGADIVTTWTEHATNVWKATIDRQPKVVLFDGTVGTVVDAIGSIDAAYEWFWASNVLYVYSAVDPSTVYTSPGVESAYRPYGIWTNGATGKGYIVIQDIRIYGTGFGSANAINCPECPNWTFSGITIEKCAGFGIVSIGATNYTITGCTITGIRALTEAWKGIYFAPPGVTNLPANNTITLSTINYWTNYAVSIKGLNADNRTTGNVCSHNDLSHCSTGCYFAYSAESTINDNICDDNLIGGAAGEEYGIALQTGSTATIYNNTCTNGRIGIEIWGYTGGAFPLDGPSDGNKVYNNVLANNTLHGFSVYEGNCDNTECHHNLIYGNGKSGASISDHNTASTGCSFYNNVLYGNDTTDVGEGNIYLAVDFASGWILKNNISYHTNRACLKIDAASPTHTHTNNCYYRSSGVVIDTTGTDYTLEQVTTYEATAVAADPLLVNAPSADFAIQVWSPCVDTGVDVGITADFAGKAIPHGPLPDIGAYETYGYNLNGAITVGGIDLTGLTYRTRTLFGDIEVGGVTIGGTLSRFIPLVGRITTGKIGIAGRFIWTSGSVAFGSVFYLGRRWLRDRKKKRTINSIDIVRPNQPYGL